MAKINHELGSLLKIARVAVADYRKVSFVDVAQVGGQMPPAGGGQMPPMPGADPMAGPVPPMDPMASMGVGGVGGEAAGGAPLTEDRVLQLIQESQGAGTAPMGGVPGEEAKKKVDVNTEIYHIKKLLCYLLEQLGLEVPPTTLLGDPAEDPQAAPEQALNDPASAGASPESAIKPIQALQGASPSLAAGGGEAPKAAVAVAASDIEGLSKQGMEELAGEAGALARLLRAKGQE